jgi:hypothetical protein
VPVDVIGFERARVTYADAPGNPAVRVLVNGTPLEHRFGLDDDGEPDVAPLDEAWVRRRTGTIWSGQPYVVDPRRRHSEPDDGSVPVLNCACGDFGCGGVSAFIERDGRVVRWRGFRPRGSHVTERGFTFDAAQYDAALTGLLADR